MDRARDGEVEVTIPDAPTSFLFAPVAIGAQVIAARLFPENQRVVDMVFAVVVLALVEWTLHRRIKSHLASVNSILTRLIATSQSLDAQHEADDRKVAAVRAQCDTTAARLDGIADRVVRVESKLGIQSPTM